MLNVLPVYFSVVNARARAFSLSPPPMQDGALSPATARKTAQEETGTDAAGVHTMASEHAYETLPAPPSGAIGAKSTKVKGNKPGRLGEYPLAYPDLGVRILRFMAVVVRVVLRPIDTLAA